MTQRLKSFWWWARHDFYMLFMCPWGRHAKRTHGPNGAVWCRWCLEPLNEAALEHEAAEQEQLRAERAAMEE